jgi:hypothetical protein
MRSRLLLLQALFAGVALVLSSANSPPAFARPVRVVRATAADLFGIAETLKRGGHTHEAEQVLELLSHDPNSDVRNEARYRR